MCKVACTKKQASCIVGNILNELVPICEHCNGLQEDELLLVTVDGLEVLEADVGIVRGRNTITGKPTEIRFTDYGFELHGDGTGLEHIKEARCLYVGR